MSHEPEALVHPTYPRTIPARRPAGLQTRSTRYTLRWRRPIPYLIADWFGVQGTEPDSPAAQQFRQRMHAAFDRDAGPEAVEVMDCPIDETGLPTLVVVAYWTSAATHARWSLDPQWAAWWQSEDRLDGDVGYWRETLVCPYDRHETVYSHQSKRFGLARTADGELVETGDYGYFGAARDRIPASAIDDLASPLGPEVRLRPVETRGRRVVALTPLNTTVIRSGQYWQDSEPAQAADYENTLRPKLERGLDYLADDPHSGCLYLRRLTNSDDHGHRRRETSVSAVFQELAGLERWTADHHTHKAIFEHQMAMSREYGARRDVVTWHEAFVLPAGNRFEYVNCSSGTGMTRILGRPVAGDGDDSSRALTPSNAATASSRTVTR